MKIVNTVTLKYSSPVYSEPGNRSMQIQGAIEYDVETLLQRVLDTMRNLRNGVNVSFRTPEELRQKAQRYAVRTAYGSYNFVSTVKNRSAWLTVYIGSPRVLQRQLNQRQKEILRSAPKTVELHSWRLWEPQWIKTQSIWVPRTC